MARSKKRQTTPRVQRSKTSRRDTPSLSKPKVVKAEKLPSILKLTAASWRLLRQHAGLFLWVIFSAWAGLLLVVGISQQVQYQSTGDLAELYSAEVAEGVARKLFETGVLFFTILTGGQNASLTAGQQLFVSFIYIQLWLVTIWLLRHRLAGTMVSLRDGIYNASSALIPMLVLGLVALLQLLPLALGLTMLNVTAVALQGAWTLMLVGVVLVGLGIVTLYWLIGTLFASVIVTIPGTYPLAALRSARQLISGMRTQLLLRLLWLGFVMLFVFSLCAVLVLLLDRFVLGANTLLVAVAVQLASVAVGVYAITYTYLLYREAIDVRG